MDYLHSDHIKDKIHITENQTDKVIIDSTRSVHDDCQEYYSVSLINVDLTIMDDLRSDRIFQNTVKMRSSSGGYSV
jgi:hypothetical protein